VCEPARLIRWRFGAGAFTSSVYILVPPLALLWWRMTGGDGFVARLKRCRR